MTLADIRFGLRVLRKNPLFTVAAISSIALAIGANSAVFSLVNAVLVHQMPYKDPQSLVWIWSTRTDRDKAFFCLPDLADFLEQNHTLIEISAFSPWGANFTGITPAERFQGARVSANVFRMLGVQPEVGRLLVPADDAPSAPNVLVLSHGLWVRRFGTDASIVGRKFSLSGDDYTVAGVLPPAFIFPGTGPGDQPEILTALKPLSDPRRVARDNHFLRVFARRKPSATLAEVYQDMAAITARLRDLYPVTNAKNTPPRVLLLGDEIVGGYKNGLWMVMAAVGSVLLIACFNLANLLLSKSASRQREIAVRLALGAGRWRIARQVLTESLMLALLGGVAGVGLAVGAIRFLSMLAPPDLPRTNEIGVDANVLLFTLLSTIFAGLAFGLAPALHVSRMHLNERGSTSSGSRTRRLLVLAEVTLSLVLLGVAGLLIRSYSRLQAVSPGFTMPGLLSVNLSPPGGAKLFSEKVLTSLRSINSVKAAAIATLLPLSGGNARFDFYISGRQPATPSEVPAAQIRWVSPEYFRTMGIPIQGREFLELDGPRDQPVVIVDESLAARFFGKSDLGKTFLEKTGAIGAHIVMEENGVATTREIVGIAGAVKHFSLDEETLNTIYVPLYQTWPAFIPVQTATIRLAVRTQGDPRRASDAIRTELARIAPEVPASVPRTLEEFWSANIAARKFNRTLLAVFAAAALLLAASGLYALISYSIVQRTREIGVRMALGARPGAILALIIREGLSILLPGVLLGWIGSFSITRLTAGLVYQTQPFDAVTLFVASSLLIVVATVAMLAPAWKATHIDPTTALRLE